MIAITRNVIADYLGGRRKIRGRIVRLEDLAEHPSHEDDRETFNLLWVENLVRLALEGVRDWCEQQGTSYYEALRMYAVDDMSYEQIADRLGSEVGHIKKYIFRARERLKDAVKDLIADYTLTGEYAAEVEYLGKFLMKTIR